MQISTELFDKIGCGPRVRCTVIAPDNWCDQYVLEVPISGNDLHSVAAGCYAARQFASMLKLSGTWTVVSNVHLGQWLFTCGALPEVAFNIEY